MHRRGRGRSPGRSCGLSRSTMRTRTRPANIAASIWALRAGARCLLRRRVSSPSPERCREAGRPCRFRHLSGTPRRLSTWARSELGAERTSTKAASSELSARAAPPSQASRMSTSACARRLTSRGTSTRLRSCRRSRFPRPQRWNPSQWRWRRTRLHRRASTRPRGRHPLSQPKSASRRLIRPPRRLPWSRRAAALRRGPASTRPLKRPRRPCR